MRKSGKSVYLKSISPTVQIPSDIRYIRKASAEIERFLKSHGADESVIFDVRLCAEEAIKNAIMHGNRNKKEKPVYIFYSLKGNEFTLIVEDVGAGFDALKIPDPTLDENLYNTSGRGVFIINKLMDKVQYRGRGNKVFMVKFIKRRNGGGDAI